MKTTKTPIICTRSTRYDVRHICRYESTIQKTDFNNLRHFAAWPWYHPWHNIASPRYLMVWHEIPWPLGWCRVIPWVVPGQPPRQPPRHSMATSRHGMATPTTPLTTASKCGRAWARVQTYSVVYGSVLCRGIHREWDFQHVIMWFHGMPRHVVR